SHLRREQRKLHVLSQRLHIEERHVWIERQHLTAHCTKQSFRTAFRASDENPARVVILSHRRPDKRARLFSDVEILARLRNANNLNPWSTRPLKTKSFAYSLSRRLQLRHQTPHKVFVHNGDLLGLLLVCIRKLAALQERRAHRFEVGWSNTRGHRHRRIIATLGGLTFDEDRVAVVVETKRDITHHRRRFDSRQRLQTFL